MSEQSVKLPGYYVTTTIRTDDWPYITSKIVAGPYRDPPLQVNPDEEIKYWIGHKWATRGIVR